MTSVCRELGAEQGAWGALTWTAVIARFAEIYERRAVDKAAAELAETVPGAEALAMAAPVPREDGASASVR